MPVWAIVLAVFVPLLWLVYCFIHLISGKPCSGRCVMSLVLATMVAGVWLAWTLWAGFVGGGVIIAGLAWVTFAIMLAMILGSQAARRQRERTRADGAIAAGAVGATALGAGQTERRSGEADSASSSDAAGDLGDFGIDI